MGKFVLKELVDKASKVGLAKKLDLVWKAKGLSKSAMDKVYAIYFWAIDGFACGNPTKWQVYGWKIYVINGVDIQFNLDSKKRCESILKYFKQNAFVKQSDRVWILKELKPYFENSLKVQTGKSLDMLDAVSDGKMQEFLDKVKKEKEGRFK